MKKKQYSKLIYDLDYTGIFLIGMAFIGFILSRTELANKFPYILHVTFGSFVLGQSLVVVTKILKTTTKRNTGKFIKLFFLYTILSLWDFFLIIMFIPFLILSLIIGPFMIGIFAISIAMLVVYIIEEIIKYDISRVSSPLKNPYHAFIDLIAIIISFFILKPQFKDDASDDIILDKWISLMQYIKKVIQARIEKITNQN